MFNALSLVYETGDYKKVFCSEKVQNVPPDDNIDMFSQGDSFLSMYMVVFFSQSLLAHYNSCS